MDLGWSRPARELSGRSVGELFPFYARKKSGLFLWAAFRKRGYKNPQDLLSKFKAESLSIHRNCLESSLRKKQIFLNLVSSKSCCVGNEIQMFQETGLATLQRWSIGEEEA